MAHVWVRMAASLFAGLLLSVAYEPLALPVALPFALAIFTWTTIGVTAGRGFALGAVFGASFFLLHTSWMGPAVGVGPWVGMCLILAGSMAVYGSVAPMIQTLRWWPLLLAVAWTAFEAQRGVWPYSGMPWGRLSFAAIDSPVAASLGYLGLTGLSFGLAWFSFTLVWACGLDSVATADRSYRPAGVAVAVGLGAVMTVPTVLPATPEPVGAAQVAMIQGSVPGAGNDVLVDTAALTRNHVEATAQLAARVRTGQEPPPDFVIWPENSTASDPFGVSGLDQSIGAAVQDIGVPILVGAIVDGPPGLVLNQGVVWDPATGPGERYSKQNPVAFGEYIPYREYLADAMPSFDRIPRDMLAGQRVDPLTLGDVPVANAICFDIAYQGGLYAQVRNGAEMITVQTSNSTFIFTDQVEQQFAITRLRAIETGRWLAVASANGISGVIAPDGRVVARTEKLDRAVLNEQVELADQVTPAVWMGEWPSRASYLAALIIIGAAIARRRSASTESIRSGSTESDPLADRGVPV